MHNFSEKFRSTRSILRLLTPNFDLVYLLQSHNGPPLWRSRSKLSDIQKPSKNPKNHTLICFILRIIDFKKFKKIFGFFWKKLSVVKFQILNYLKWIPFFHITEVFNTRRQRNRESFQFIVSNFIYHRKICN